MFNSDSTSISSEELFPDDPSDHLESDQEGAENDEVMFADEPDQELSSESDEVPWRVMVVDDDPDVHLLTTMVFSGVQFEGRGLEFIHAHSGTECLELLEMNEDIAMVLLDVVMETNDAGFKVVKEIRDVLDNQVIRIVLRTGQPGLAPEESVILDYDINDYVSKTEPFSRLLTSVITGLRSYRDLKIRRQFDLAAALEEHMLPQHLPELSNYEFFAKTQSALQAGGDFYEVLNVSDHEVVFAVGDVSGKGLPASLYVSATLSMLRTQVECYQQLGHHELLRPASILKMLNRLLLKTLKRGKFVTVFVGVLDIRSHQLTYASAGHCASYIVEEGTPPQPLKAPGMVCGLCGAPFENMIKEGSVKLNPGSYLLMNSDGLTEATNRKGEVYGDDAYVQSVDAIEQGVSAEKAVHQVWNDVMRHLNFGDLSDDCTLLCVHRL